MNREEKHELVCQLYTEGKTMREISKEVQMSFRDIGRIIKNLNEQETKLKELSKESQALKLFQKGKNPVEVAISMNLNPSEVVEIYKQFWKLEGLHKLLYLYETLKMDASLLVKVHHIIKEYSLTKEDIINIVDYGDDYNYLIDEVEEKKRQLKYILEQLNRTKNVLQSTKKDQLVLSNEIDNYNHICLQKASYIEDLDAQIIDLEDQILKLKRSDEYFIKFERYARKKLETVTKDSKWILGIAIAIVLESLRRDPKKIMIINDDSVSQESYEAHILDMSNDLFEKILSQLMDITLRDDPDNAS